MSDRAASLVAGAPARSYLFVPGDRPERFSKALASGADAVILDLEDGVAPVRKSAAREHVAQWLSAERPVYLRINDAASVWFNDDLALCRVSGVAGIVLPKAEEVESIACVEAAGQGNPVLPMVESAQGFANLDRIARQRGVERLLFGALDLQCDLGMEGAGTELLYFRSHLVLSSRLAGLAAPVDSVTTAIHDAELLQADAEAARRLGFGGKLCVHPGQVDAVNAAFSPTREEIAWAERVMEVWQQAAGGVTLVDGKMIDRPIARRAESILMASRRIARRTGDS